MRRSPRRPTGGTAVKNCCHHQAHRCAAAVLLDLSLAPPQTRRAQLCACWVPGPGPAQGFLVPPRPDKITSSSPLIRVYSVLRAPIRPWPAPLLCPFCDDGLHLIHLSSVPALLCPTPNIDQPPSPEPQSTAAAAIPSPTDALPGASIVRADARMSSCVEIYVP